MDLLKVFLDVLCCELIYMFFVVIQPPAAAGEDYSDVFSILSTIDFVFPRKRDTSSVMQQQQCVNISILSDVIVEDTEDFYAALSTMDSAVVLTPDRARIEIIDNDRT